MPLMFWLNNKNKYNGDRKSIIILNFIVFEKKKRVNNIIVVLFARILQSFTRSIPRELKKIDLKENNQMVKSLMVE